MRSEHETLRALVLQLSALHPNNCDAVCGGGRTDCCDQCVMLETLVPAVRAFNSLHTDLPSITLPAWCMEVRVVHVLGKPLPEFQHEHCRRCWAELNPPREPRSVTDALKRYYHERALK